MEAKLDTTRVMQIEILTHNIQDTAEKWAKFLGIPVPEVFHSDGYDKTAAEYYGKPCYGRCYQAFINFENIQIEFIQPDEEPSIWRECLDRDGEGLHHLAFGVKNMAENVKKCEDGGWGLQQKGEYTGGRYAYLNSIGDLKMITEFLEDD